MSKLIITNIMSLDGCYEGPGRNVMALPMDGAFDSYNLERMKAADTVLLGGNSYKLFSSFWPGMANNRMHRLPIANFQSFTTRLIK